MRDTPINPGENMYAELETLRKEEVKTNNILLLMLGGLLLAILIFLHIGLSGESVNVPCLVLVVICIVIAVLLLKSQHKGKTIFYEQEFLRLIKKPALEAVFSNMVYEESRGVDEDSLKDSKIFHHFHRYKGYNFLSGEYNDTKFHRSDL